MMLAYSTWAPVRFRSGLSSSCSARMRRLLSGVRSSWDMLAMNSDLYLDEMASSPTFSSTRSLACSTSRFFSSASMFFGQLFGLALEVLVGVAKLVLLGEKGLGL